MCILRCRQDAAVACSLHLEAKTRLEEEWQVIHQGDVVESRGVEAGLRISRYVVVVEVGEVGTRAQREEVAVWRAVVPAARHVVARSRYDVRLLLTYCVVHRFWFGGNGSIVVGECGTTHC